MRIYVILVSPYIFPTGFLKEFSVAYHYDVSPQIFLTGFLRGVFGLQYTDDELTKGEC